MNKQKFLQTLEERLNGLSNEDLKKPLDFYSEMIDEHLDDGMTESEAVEAIGSIDEIVEAILSETPIQKLIKQKIKPQRNLRAGEIALIVLGSPIWVPLLVAAICVVLMVYAVIWALIVSLYAVDLALAVGAMASFAGIALYVPSANSAGMLMCVGVGLLCAGVSILLFFAFNKIAKGAVWICKKYLVWQKSLFVGRKG